MHAIWHLGFISVINDFELNTECCFFFSNCESLNLEHTVLLSCDIIEPGRILEIQKNYNNILANYWGLPTITKVLTAKIKLQLIIIVS